MVPVLWYERKQSVRIITLPRCLGYCTVGLTVGVHEAR